VSDISHSFRAQNSRSEVLKVGSLALEHLYMYMYTCKLHCCISFYFLFWFHIDFWGEMLLLFCYRFSQVANMVQHGVHSLPPSFSVPPSPSYPPCLLHPPATLLPALPLTLSLPPLLDHRGVASLKEYYCNMWVNTCMFHVH